MTTFRPVFFKTSLARSLASGGSETEIYLNSFTTKDDHTLAMTDVGDKLYLVINPKGSNREVCSITGINTAVTPPKGTGLTRGYNFYNSSTSSDRKTQHSAGEVVIITNDDHFLNEQYGKLDDDQTWAGINTFSQVPSTTGGNPVSGNDLVRKTYVDGLLAGIASTVSIIVAGTAGETLAAGQLVYLKAADGRWWLCDADTAATVENIIMGMAQGAGSAAGAITNGVMLQGVDTNQSGLSLSTKYYASNTAGGISSSAGTTEVTVGFSKSATSIYFNPRFDQVLTEDQQDALAGTGGTPSATNKFVTQNDTNGLLTQTGMIVPYAAAAAPTGYLLCDGSAVSRSTYATLFGVISTTYGVGDGSTTFNVPNLKGRAIIGVDSSLKVQIFACDSAFDEQVIGNVTQSADSSDKQEGTSSSKFVVAAGFATGIIGTKAVSSLSLAGRTHISLWVKSSVATSNGDLQILLDDTANCASPLETLNIPALVANVWTKVYLTLANPHTDTAIVSVGLKLATDLGAQSVWLDDICKGDPFELGQKGGELRHTLVTAEMPAHTHGITGGQQTNTGGSGALFTGTAGASGSTGGDLSHNTLPQYLALNYIIKT